MVSIDAGYSRRERDECPHFPKADFNTLAKTKKSKIRRGVIKDPKRDDSWYKQMPDPCQVEG
jgi:hypothetical protein